MPPTKKKAPRKAAAARPGANDRVVLDLGTLSLRDANESLQTAEPGGPVYVVANPRGQHAVACGLQRPVEVIVEGHAGYYCAGMNQQAQISVNGNAGTGLAENMMSGTVRVAGNASQSAGASGHGGLLVIEGDAAARCGISMKGIDIVVKGSVGHMSAFMGQAGHLVVCGDAGADLGDSLYEAEIYVRGKVESLGADCERKKMTKRHRETVQALLQAAGIDADAKSFKRYGSARRLYNFFVDNVDAE